MAEKWRLIPQQAVRGLYPPPGLLLSLGDGSAVVFTGEMLAKLRWTKHVPWERITAECRQREIDAAQIEIDRLQNALIIQQAQEARDAE